MGTTGSHRILQVYTGRCRSIHYDDDNNADINIKHDDIELQRLHSDCTMLIIKHRVFYVGNKKKSSYACRQY